MKDFLEVNLTRGYKTLIDKDDFLLLNCYSWQSKIIEGKIYAKTAYRINGKLKTFYLHRIIANAKSGEYVDHINGNPLDNRRNNLRICTNAQNIRNSKIKLNNKTGYKGVQQLPSGNWRSRLTFNYKSINLGVFKNIIEAAKAYDQGAVKYFGKFARINSYGT
jgi:hypothetical protein